MNYYCRQIRQPKAEGVKLCLANNIGLHWKRLLPALQQGSLKQVSIGSTAKRLQQYQISNNTNIKRLTLAPYFDLANI